MFASVYVHIPFCLRKCLYCDFASYPGKESLFEPYVQALRTQIRRASESFPGTRVPTIYFGGGTPNVLPPESLASILDEIRRGFRVDADAEISSEANPGVASNQSSVIGETRRRLRSAVRSLREAGFNRLSLGVQSLHDDELRRLGRVHTAEEAVEAFREAREARFGNISVDLMYGIPGQTSASWRETLRRVIGLGPEHVSLYSLTVEEGTPFHEMQCEGRLELPGSDIEAGMYEDAIEMLTSAGFAHYEISNFARPGFESRHNLLYWDLQDYLGIGPAAHSCLHGRRFSTPARTAAFLAGPAAQEEQGTVTAEDFIMLQLRLARGLSLQSLRENWGVVFTPAQNAFLACACREGFAVLENDTLRLTPRGMLVQNSILCELI